MGFLTNVSQEILDMAKDILTGKQYIETGAIFEAAWWKEFGDVPTLQQLDEEREYVKAQKYRGWKIRERADADGREIVLICEDNLDHYMRYVVGLMELRKGGQKISPHSIVNKRLKEVDPREIGGGREILRQKRIVAVLEDLEKHLQDPAARHKTRYKGKGLLDLARQIVEREMQKEENIWLQAKMRREHEKSMWEENFEEEI
jgi:hypothetical protein